MSDHNANISVYILCIPVSVSAKFYPFLDECSDHKDADSRDTGELQV